MLQAARQAKEQGVDVAVGCVEPHALPQAAALLEGLEQLPTKQCLQGGICLNEFDLNGVLRRKPQLILVDELTHTNAPGCRNAKRCQDVRELLRSGIDVYTTVNVQHIESLNDQVASITGVLVRERIPDSVLTRPTRWELVDIEPRDLPERLAVMTDQVAASGSVLVNGKLQVDYAGGCAFLDGQELHLTPIVVYKYFIDFLVNKVYS